MRAVEDYNALDALEPVFEGDEVLVLYSRLIHRRIKGRWEAVGKVTPEGKVVYRR